MTAQEKRAKILGWLEIIKNREANNGFGGWVSKEEVFNVIARGMGLLEHRTTVMKSQYHGTYTERYTVVTDRETVQKVLDRMAEQGYIRISSSGKGVKIIRTK